jgi:dihydroorotase
MPNTLPPLTTPGALTRYRRDAETAAPDLTVLTTFRLMPGMTAAEVESLARAGATAGKYYPDGATTNSEGGIVDWRQVEEALTAMEHSGIVLCVHGEDPDAPVLRREAAFLPRFFEIRKAFPRLWMVLEHVSSKEGVRAVMDSPAPTAATVTLQHLYFTLDDLIGGTLDPHLFCKPVVKTAADRRSIADRLLSGDSRFFFGSDSAPHPRSVKEGGNGAAGAYAAPAALPALAEWFDREDAIEGLQPFICRFGREFYGLPPNEGTITLEKDSWTVPHEADGSVPLFAGRSFSWRILKRTAAPIEGIGDAPVP